MIQTINHIIRIKNSKTINKRVKNNTKYKIYSHDNKRIQDDIKLDFNDVLMIPKQSNVITRKDVNLNVDYTFRHSGLIWRGIPIISSNMDTISCIPMYEQLAEHNLMTCFSKYDQDIDIESEKNLHTEDCYTKFALLKDRFMFSMGISAKDFEKIDLLIFLYNPKFICIDVANGYTTELLRAIDRFKSKYSNRNITLCVGNVVTPNMVEIFIRDYGVDIVKVGIGSGCFTENTRVLMANGTYKNINKIDVGDYVINMLGKPVKVLHVMNKGFRNVLMVKIKNNYKNTYVTYDHNYLVGSYNNKTNNNTYNGLEVSDISDFVEWRPIKDRIKNKNIVSLMPKKISWSLPDTFKIDLAKCLYIQNAFILYLLDNNILSFTKMHRFINAGYDIGYIFGVYLRSPQNNTDINKFIINVCDINSQLGDKIKNCISRILNIDCSIIIKNNNDIMIYIYNLFISDILLELGNDNYKYLPEKYYCTDINYINGLYDGLSDSSFCKENNNIYIIELLQWCKINIDYVLNSDNLFLNNNDIDITNYNIKQMYVEEFHEDDYMKEKEVWDIEVDCPTHSFIADNAIVHNSVCTTRTKTGIGYPQFSAINECRDAAITNGGYIMSDGGITTPGDVGKAFGIGADFVMIGSMLAGHKECNGEIIKGPDGKEYMKFYGMSSASAMNKYNGKVDEYRTEEGKTVLVPYKGPVKNTLLDILGGLRSTCTYLGAKNLIDIINKVDFIKVNRVKNDIYGK